MGFIKHPLSQDCHSTRHSMVLLLATSSMEKRIFPTNEAMFYVFMISLRVLGTQTHLCESSEYLPWYSLHSSTPQTWCLNLSLRQTFPHSKHCSTVPANTQPGFTALEHGSWRQTLHRGWTWSPHYCKALLKSPNNQSWLIPQTPHLITWLLSC